MNTYDLNEVFTPSSPASLTFVERTSVNYLLVEAIRTKGKQIVIYGHSGTGKTTLLHNKLLQTYDANIVTRCTSDMSFEQLVLNAFDSLNPFYLKNKESKITKELGATLRADFKLISGSINSTLSNTKATSEERLVTPQLTPQKLASFFGEINSCWVIDDFHKMEQSEKKKLAQYMKVFMDESVNYPYVKIIAIGAVGTAKEVLELDNELNNRVSEINVPFLTDIELHTILQMGESKLNIKIDNSVKNQIIKFSNGLASVTHQLAFSLCMSKDIYQTSTLYTEFDREDFRMALSNYVITKSGYLYDRFEKAIEEPKNNHLPIYYHILKCFIESKNPHLSTKDVFNYFHRNRHPQQEAVIEYLLKQLMSEKKGSVLDFDQQSKTWFIPDPFFRVYCVCTMNLTKQNLQAQMDLFDSEIIDLSKSKIKKEQRALIQQAFASGEYFDF
ncbi:MAG: hypothetical protein JJ862_09755 [Roseivirga sp.]|uniref:hypothetical protein n=1 Tax=Roseivirga sp. TaxID=1964215 RepID=UPI001B26ACF7|nr:hypothetical protein [Roseivirga sp.]MBO6661448.1 hypothetical protein [Roseivirga sp.]MBO6908568.1 hypothetical protein [Roseivirga sp.]